MLNLDVVMVKKKAAAPGLASYDQLASGLHSDALANQKKEGYYNTRRTFNGDLSEFHANNKHTMKYRSYGAALRRYFLMFMRGLSFSNLRSCSFHATYTYFGIVNFRPLQGLFSIVNPCQKLSVSGLFG